MVYKEWMMKLMLNAFPPLFFNRIRVKRISEGFREIDVRVGKSILNTNLQGAIFGGTIFSGADPYYAIMYWQIFLREGIKCEAWLKAAEIDYQKPARSSLTYQYRLSEEDVQEAVETVKKEGRFKKWHDLYAIDKWGDVCAHVRTLVYLRTPKGSNKPTSNF